MDKKQQAAAMLEEAGIRYHPNEPMERHTSFGIGGAAALFCVPENGRKLAAAIKAAQACALPAYILGKGTNVLFADEGYPGLVIRIGSGFAAVQTEDGKLVAGAGAALEAVCLAARDESLAGLEFAYGIPGSVGGAVYMNAGAYDGEMRCVLERVEYLDEAYERHSLPVDELMLGYRESVFQHRPWCILSATFSLQADDREDITKRMTHNMALRRQKQPLEMPSAGSAFKRPHGAFAGELIDRSGLRGYRVGNAAISEKHCGFIVNLGGATCRDVLTLADHVVATVKEKTGYLLEKEIRVVGKEATLA